MSNPAKLDSKVVNSYTGFKAFNMPQAVLQSLNLLVTSTAEGRNLKVSSFLKRKRQLPQINIGQGEKVHQV